MLRSYLSPGIFRRRVRPFSVSSRVWNTPPQQPPSRDGTESVSDNRESNSTPPPDHPSPSDSPSTSSTSSHDYTPHRDSISLIPSYDLSVVKQRLREWSDQAAITVRTRADEFTTTTKTTLSQLGLHLNKATGYEEIELLKRQVVEQEARISETRKAAREAKQAYAQAVMQRSNSQREVNDLLQRKSTWTDSDVGRFTNLVKADHLAEQEEARSKAAVDETEDAVEREFSELMRSILARYHEEQVWSDKIRSASTYGSLAALGLNLFVFVMAIVIVEPWKRRRLAQTFEKKIEEMSKDTAAMVEGGMVEIKKELDEQAKLIKAAVPPPSRESVVRLGREAEKVPAPIVATANSPETPLEKYTQLVKDPYVGTALAASAVAASAIGWLARSWWGH